MLRVACALSFLWILPALAQPMQDRAAQLAGRISSLLPRRTTVSLEFQNLTANAPAESSSFRSALEEELRKAGIEVTQAAQPETRVRVSLAENARGLLFVAEIFSGDNRQVALLPWNSPPAGAQKPRIRLTRQPVFEQTEPLLDFLLLDSGAGLLALSPAKLASYRMVDGKWTPAGVAALPLTRPVPRDPRGRILNTSSGVRVFVPGASCSAMLEGTLKLNCAPGNEAWPSNPRDSAAPQVRWLTDRNFLETDGVRGAFYSAAASAFASTDGRTLDRAGEPIASAEIFGSDIAAVENPCGSAAAVLAAKAGEDVSSDQVQAYEIASGQAIAASEAAPLQGPVTALWPAETRGQVTLVIRNSKTGNYEASRLGVACAE